MTASPERAANERRKASNMDFGEMTLQDATNFLHDAFRAAPIIAGALDPHTPTQVRVEVRVTVDNGESYSKMPWSQEAYIANGEWQISAD